MKRGRLFLAFWGAMLLAAPVRADVFEIADGGVVNVRSGGGDVRWIRPSDALSGMLDADPEAMPEVPADAITRIAPPAVPAAWRIPLQQAAEGAAVSPDLLAALVGRESRWSGAAVSAKGAFGLAQLMPATARALAVDTRDPAANLAGGARYLRQMLDLFDGDVERALAAYNAGPGRVIRAGGVPAIAETRAYVAAISARLSISALQGQ